METTLWRYVPEDTTALAIRTAPDVNAKRSDFVLQPKEVFGVSEASLRNNSVTFLKLADGRGWAFDSDPQVGTLCVQEHGLQQLVLDAQDAHMLVGTWRYGNKGGKYQISLTEWGQLRFDEQPASGRRAYGFLERNGSFFQADLNYHDGEPVGTIRLSYNDGQGAISSRFRTHGKSEWQQELTSHKRRQVSSLPTVLENELGVDENEPPNGEIVARPVQTAYSKQDCSPKMEDTAPQSAPQSPCHDVQFPLAVSRSDVSVLSKSCPIVQGKSGEAEAVVLASRHADMMLQLLREAQRDRDLTQQRLSLVENDNTQLRQILTTREAQHRELELERNMLAAQLKESRAQVESLIAACKEPRLQGGSSHEEKAFSNQLQTAQTCQNRSGRQQSCGPEDRAQPVKSLGRVSSCQATKSYEGIPSKTYEPMQTKSYDGIPCARTAPSSPPTPVHPRIVKTVSQPVRIIQVPTPVRSGLRVASRERPRYSWQSCMSPSSERTGARACSPTGF
eukprot:CAMPEP_0172791164 /NCGR_PEP_ID=MMETSP1074-20121228/208330_1 /TAXON_ID=2916 /ORGANISM="Ceratium fusus, Strain PA161109" /LENGTH=505 /DNA_ID=CAMNT_0013628221 /DNA_START=23 /DNA_END=1540 /DNA_ORIENTATION=+